MLEFDFESLRIIDDLKELLNDNLGGKEDE